MTFTVPVLMGDGRDLRPAIEALLHDEGWRDIYLEECDDGMFVEACHANDPARARVEFGLGPADLDAIVRTVAPPPPPRRTTRELRRAAITRALQELAIA